MGQDDISIHAFTLSKVYLGMSASKRGSDTVFHGSLQYWILCYLLFCIYTFIPDILLPCWLINWELSSVNLINLPGFPPICY